MRNTNFKDNNRTLDAMFGLAIGDALGVPAEFQSREKLKQHPITDMVGNGTHNQPAGTWSDDTSMAIATMDSISECEGIDYADNMKKFLEWVRDYKYTASGVFFDIGITTSNAIQRYRSGTDPLDCGDKDIKSNGNGSLMRILPVVLYSYYIDLPDKNDTEIINNMSSLTHANEISKLGCKIFGDFTKFLLKGETKEEAYREVRKKHYEKYYSEEAINYYEKVLDGSLRIATEEEIKSSGFVVSTLEASIWANLTSDSYEEAVLKAVNLGNDTDTVGAVTGAISGIIYGYDNIPEKWRNKLINNEFLTSTCQKFDKTIQNIIPYEEVNNTIKRYEDDVILEEWRMFGVGDVVEVLKDFKQEDWKRLFSNISNHSNTWKSMLARCLAYEQNDYTTAALELFTEADDIDLLVSTISSLNHFDHKLLKNKEKIDIKLSEKAPQASRLQRMVFDDFINKGNES